MGLTNPYRQNNYQGEYATETGTGSVLAWIRANEWDSAGDGTGDPQEGMCFYDTAVDRFKIYANAAWKGLAYTTDPAGAGGSDHQLQFNDGGSLNGAATLYWDHGNSRQGLGTSAPTVDFDVVTASDAARGIKQRNYSATADAPAVLALHRARGTAGTPADINTGDTLGLLSISGRSAGADYVGAQIGVVADGTTAKKTYVTISTLDGTTFAERMRITDVGVQIGKVAGASGQIDLLGTTSGTVTLKVADAAGSWTMTLPIAAPGVTGYVLSATTAGVCSWIAAGGGTTVDAGTAAGQVLYWDHGNTKWTYAETSEWVWDDTNKRVGINVAAPSSRLDVGGDIEVASDAWTYYGDPATNGSWRVGRLVDDLVVEKRIAGTWTTKHTFA